MNNREKGLVLYKLASGHPQMTKLGFTQLLKTLPNLIGKGVKYLPSKTLYKTKDN